MKTLVFFGVPILLAAQGRVAGPRISRIDLDRGWTIQSSASVSQQGAEISMPGFNAAGWYGTSLPSTVIGALAGNKVYPDPYYGMNLRLIPGTTYDLGDNFAVDPTPPGSPFGIPWWYRTVFTVSRRAHGKRLWLNFDSINYRADIWLNGRLIAGSDQARGMYRHFEFDITDAVVPGANALAVEVYPPTENDLSIAFVDWNPLPADRDMGLVRDVYILTTGPVAVRNVQVATSLNTAMDEARLTLYADVRNASGEAVDGTLEGAVGTIAVSKRVQLAAGEAATVALGADEFPQLAIRNPALWWPNGLGPQNLYGLHMAFRAGGAVSDSNDVPFGIREVTSELDARQHRLFRINRKPILIRGAAWTPDMMLRADSERDDYELRYVRDMHLNAIRLEGKLEMRDSFFDLADRYGIMVMAGWCCCSAWEHWENWTPADYTTAQESLRDQVRRLRSHPSVFAFLYGSDNAPPPQAEQVYLKVFQQERWPNPYLPSATDTSTSGFGLTGVKMGGPYDYVAPNYWLLNTQRGGAFGFNTEGGPGPAIPLLSSLQAMMPAQDLWPIGDQVFNFHAGSGSFADVRTFTAALNGRYGTAKDLSDYVWKSQVMTYEAERAMYEGYGRNKYTSTGVIHWMLNNAWPGLIWHLYDWYLRPGGGYFGAKKANEPVHVQYSYDDRSVAVVNSLYNDLPGYSVTAKVYNMDLTEKFSRTAAIDIGADSSTRVFYVPDIGGLSTTYFVRLVLNDSAGNTVSSNFYWLSTQPDVNDFVGGDYRFAPILTYADMTDLASLPPAAVSITSNSEFRGADRVEHVTVRNTSSQLAFFVHLTVLQGKEGRDIAPVYWDDNFFSLMPGEQREVAGEYPAKLLGGAQPYIQADGWNVGR